MGLLEQQNLMARLYVDENLRRYFMADSIAASEGFGLSATEINEIASVLPDELNSFAVSLFRKRLREIENMLPLTRKSLGVEFEIWFRRYNDSTPAAREMDRAHDALGFCRYIEREDTGEAKSAARFERLKRQFFIGEKSFVFTSFEGRRYLWFRIGGRVIQRSF